MYKTPAPKGKAFTGLKAQKIDMDFNADDFFDSFGAGADNAGPPAAGAGGGIAGLMGNPFDVAPAPSKNALIETKEADDFLFNQRFTPADSRGPAKQSTKPLYEFGGGSSGGNHLNEQEAKERLRELGNKKAISSADFECNNEAAYKERFRQFDGAKAISSAAFFGEEEAEDPVQGRDSLNEAKERIAEGLESVMYKAKGWKDSAMNFISTLRES